MDAPSVPESFSFFVGFAVHCFLSLCCKVSTISSDSAMATLMRPFSAVTHKVALRASATICSSSTNSKSLAPSRASVVSSSSASVNGRTSCSFKAGGFLRGSSGSRFYGRLFGLRNGVAALRQTRWSFDLGLQ